MQLSKTFIVTFSTSIWKWISEGDQTDVIHLRLGRLISSSVSPHSLMKSSLQQDMIP